MAQATAKRGEHRGWKASATVRERECRPVSTTSSPSSAPPIPPRAAREVIISRAALNSLRDQLRRYKEDASGEALEILGDVVEATSHIFGRNVTVHRSGDPEYPEEKKTVLTAVVDWPFEKIIEAEQEWAQEISRIVPGQSSLRLLVYPAQ